MNYFNTSTKNMFKDRVQLDAEKELEKIDLNGDEKFKYMLLSRMEQDCKYFLGFGNRNTKFLWAHNTKEQINIMKNLHNSFPDDKKPVWLSMNKIEEYEEKMELPFETLVNRNNRNEVLDALAKNPWDLKWADDEIKNDEEIVKHCISIDPWTFQFASEEIKDSLEIATLAYNSDPKTSIFMNDNIKNRIESLSNLENDIEETFVFEKFKL